MSSSLTDQTSQQNVFRQRVCRFPKNISLTTVLLILILLAAASLRLLYIIETASTPLQTVLTQSDVMDQFRFLQAAQDIMGHHWLGSQVTRYSPVYSYIIALVFKFSGQNIYHVFLLQSILGILAVTLVFKTTSLVFENKNIGLIAAFFMAFSGPMIFYEGTLLRASLISTTNLLAFYLLLKALKGGRAHNLCGAGLCIGFSLILRPNILPLGILPYLFFTVKGKTSKKVFSLFLFSLGIVLMILPLYIRNNALGKKVLISYQGPSSFWIGNTRDSTGIGLPRTPLRNQLAEEAQGSGVKTLEILFREMRTHPRAYVELYGRKILMYFNGYETPANTSYDLFRENSLALKIAFVNFSVICPLALLGIFLALRNGRHISLPLMLLAVLSFSVIAFHIQGRYRIPAVPFFILFASYAFYILIRYFRQKRYNSAGKALLLLIILSVMTKPNEIIIRKTFGNRIRGSDYESQSIALHHLYADPENLTSSLKKRHLLIKAIDSLMKALKVIPPRKKDFLSDCLIEVGLHHLRLGQDDEANKAFQAVTAHYGKDNHTIVHYINNRKKELMSPPPKAASFDMNRDFLNRVPAYLRHLGSSDFEE